MAEPAAVAAESEQTRSGSSILRRVTVGAAGVLLLAGLGATALARHSKPAEPEPEYTYASFKRRTEGPDYASQISKEEWDQARAQLKVNKLKLEEERVKAAVARRLAQEQEAARRLQEDGNAEPRELWDLFKMLNKQEGEEDANQAQQMRDQEAQALQAHHAQHGATEQGAADAMAQQLHGQGDNNDDADQVLVNANTQEEFTEDNEAQKAVNQDELAGLTAEERRQRFEELQEKAKAKAAAAKKAFEEKEKARLAIIEAKRKAEQEKIEAALKYKKMKEKKIYLEDRYSQALEEKQKIKRTVSLYCMALMMPMGYEAGLLLAQKERGVGIFQCDEWAVYSNQSKMANGDPFPFPVHEVKSPDGQGISLFVPLGGRWHTALNRDVFNQVWLEVVKVDRYRHHDWTVKVDPDSVFFPGRLKEVIYRRTPLKFVHTQGPEPDHLDCDYCKKPGYQDQTCASHVHWLQSEGHSCMQALESVARAPGLDCGCQCNDFTCDLGAEQAMYINNCQWGLHGPIEVFSRRAIATYIAGLPICANLLPRAWGEDKFIDQCMIELGLKRVDAFDVMSEIACGDQPAPCGQFDTTFHPFKNVEKWMACWNFANKFGHGPEDQLAAIKVEQAEILQQLRLHDQQQHQQ
eukprot:gb/GFBE01036238.1/.p1 GENE.gb/GFBE01036238.1/~~gb/GFBE01036238.1/.p1  ORF type:complete len:636 (+),score=158.82 gb/GFBE01036238.1/:1-1908(+)